MLEERVLVDQITVDEHGNVGVRTATRILKDGVVIAETFHRKVIPADAADDGAEAEMVRAVRTAIKGYRRR